MSDTDRPDRADRARRWTVDHPGGGRADVDGNVWFAGDPYPTWCRYHERELIRVRRPDLPKDVHLRVSESGVPGGYPLCSGAKSSDSASFELEVVSCAKCLAEVRGTSDGDAG